MASLVLDTVDNLNERNALGQYATPPRLARDILDYARRLVSPLQRIRFLEPAFGMGALYAALLQAFPRSQIEKAWGYEIDTKYGSQAKELWKAMLLDLEIEDFTRVPLPDSERDRANLLVCNPPYVRHQHLPSKEKVRLQSLVYKVTRINLNGMAGLYCYFLLLSDGWMADGGLAAWLIPSEFMDVNYGQPIREYLTQNVTLLHIHRFDPNEVQFEDVLVSSAIVWFRKREPTKRSMVEFSYGGTLLEPRISCEVHLDMLRKSAKWTQFPEASLRPAWVSMMSATRRDLKLSDLFNIKRGLATGANKFFIVSPEQIEEYRLPSEFLKPILPSSRYLPKGEIRADDNGDPILDRQRFLLDCDLPESEVEARYPDLWKYLQTGVTEGIHIRHLCAHRSIWYRQEQRPPPPFLCTYMGSDSKRPFRFILNHSKATASNRYLLLYPAPTLERILAGDRELLKKVWRALNAISADELKAAGRVYGGGLYKLEPNELANVSAERVLAALPGDAIGDDRESQ